MVYMEENEFANLTSKNETNDKLLTYALEIPTSWKYALKWEMLFKHLKIDTSSNLFYKRQIYK